jgi:hypothetical protein
MTERRPHEELVCPTFAAAMIAREGTFYRVTKEAVVDDSTLPGEVLEGPEFEPMDMVLCLGEKCAMWALNFKGCGLRIK